MRHYFSCHYSDLYITAFNTIQSKCSEDLCALLLKNASSAAAGVTYLLLIKYKMNCLLKYNVLIDSLFTKNSKRQEQSKVFILHIKIPESQTNLPLQS